MRAAGRAFALACALALAGCSYIPWFQDDAKKPAPLAEFSAQVTPSLAWSASVGKAKDYRFVPKVDGTRIFAAAADGTVTILDAANGAVVARIDTARALSGGISGGGDTFIVGTIKGQVAAFDTAGKEKWVAQVGGEVLAPAVPAGKNVIVRTADGRIFALAAADGKRQWVYQRTTPALLLRAEAGVHVTPTNVVVGYPGGKLIALDLGDGKLTWEVTVSLPRGSTELERVADVAGVPLVDGGRICAAAFQGKVACFEIQGGNAVWARDISSATGIAMDDRGIYLSDDKDNVHALDRDSGSSRWKQDKFARRKMSTPVVFDGKVVVGDSLGFLHVLSRDNGAIIGRLALDGSAVNAMVVTKAGVLVQTAGGMLALVRL